ncbi:flagellar type III secretion system pore protein FliP [Paenibacillus sp. SYP-B3998]|uniref:Flagellar biosynthetic protein FliP n=1 Tax=Paenibacillus sp. SYP-B3998 TaxID=2678564 RepID=A0A6G3ZU41_9BACL|nr:flagellar type III secretion system pore protein FliP [Paenibacillus sp. SYP-B3998]NEW05558.1 flagellar type III secretion system pore protein FliP [Paenibacillus sp. SYP-B3998]
MNRKKLVVIVLLMIMSVFMLSLTASAADTDPNNPIPGLNVNIGSSGTTGSSNTVTLLLLLTVLSLAPSFLILMTSFTRIVIVLGFVRTSLGTQQMPPNQVLIGLALFLTFFIMSPTLGQVNQNALQPYLKGEINQTQAFQKAAGPMKEFMFKHTRQKDLKLFLDYTKAKAPTGVEDIPITALVPAYAISELKSAFQMGFMIFIPFLVIDMVVSSTLMAMGMMMLPPVMISLPFKILLFILVDGWYLVVKSLLLSYST